MSALTYAKNIKLYPLSQAQNPPKTVFVDVLGKLYDSTSPYNINFFKSLDRVIQNDVFLTRDKAMIDILKTIGIEKGKKFNPDARTGQILERAARDARLWFETHYPAPFENAFYEGTHWALPISTALKNGIESNFSIPNQYPVDERGLLYTFIFFSTKHLGAEQFYLMSIQDNHAQALEGNSTYKITMPANVPVKRYWSVTLYDRSTHTLIKNTAWSNRSSLTPNLQKNADGSTDIYFGPTAPKGKESNWIPTDAKGQFEAMVRFYGVDQEFFAKKWKLKDIEKIK